MTAVFSIRHYLIDRVAGLIVRGGYFRAAFVWGSAPVPQPSSTPDSLNPTPFALMSLQRPCCLVRSSVQSLSLLGGSLFAFYQQRAKSGCIRRPPWNKMSASPSEPVQLARVSRSRWVFQVIVIFVHLQNAANTFISKRLRCVVLPHSADEASEKRVLRRACFSEIMRTRLIDREHLSHFDTLAQKKGCSASIVWPGCG